MQSKRNNGLERIWLLDCALLWLLILTCFVSEKHNCSSSEFLCVNNVPPSRRCIPRSWVCDGDMDCADGYDERQNCTRGSCSENDFTCSNGQCVPGSYRWVGTKNFPVDLSHPLGQSWRILWAWWHQCLWLRVLLMGYDMLRFFKNHKEKKRNFKSKKVF